MWHANLSVVVVRACLGSDHACGSHNYHEIIVLHEPSVSILLKRRKSSTGLVHVLGAETSTLWCVHCSPASSTIFHSNLQLQDVASERTLFTGCTMQQTSKPSSAPWPYGHFINRVLNHKHVYTVIIFEIHVHVHVHDYFRTNIPRIKCILQYQVMYVYMTFYMIVYLFGNSELFQMQYTYSCTGIFVSPTRSGLSHLLTRFHRPLSQLSSHMCSSAPCLHDWTC